MTTVINDLQIGSDGIKLVAVNSTVPGPDSKRLSFQASGANDPAEIEILPGANVDQSGMNSQIMMLGRIGDNFERFTISEINHATVIDSTANHEGAIRPVVFIMGNKSETGTAAAPGPPRAGQVAMILTADASVRLQGSGFTVPSSGTEAGGYYGSERTTLWDYGNTGDSRLIIDTRQPSPDASQTNDDAGVEYCRSGLRRWLVGLNASGAGVDSFDWYSTKTGSIGGKMSLTQEGNLGLGVTPLYPFHLEKANSGEVVGVVRNTATDGYGLSLRNGDNSRYALAVSNAAGTANSIQLFGSGRITCVNLTQTSDATLKKNVQPLENTLEKVRELRGVSFEWKDEGVNSGSDSDERHVGVIGQEVEQIFPELVSTDADGIRSVDYARLCVVLLEAVKELDKRVAAIADARP